MPVGSKKPKSAKGKAVEPLLRPYVIVVPITTFAPEPYELRQPLVVLVQREEEGWTASYFDANIHASGDTEEEAFRNLKSVMLDIFDSLSAEPANRLGPEPRRQLAVLRCFRNPVLLSSL